MITYICMINKISHTSALTPLTHSAASLLDLQFGGVCLLTFFFLAAPCSPLHWERGAPTIGPPGKSFLKIFYLCVCLFIYLWLHWVFVAARGLSLVVASRGYSSLWCAGFSLWSTGSRCTGFSSCGSGALGRRLSSCGTRA